MVGVNEASSNSKSVILLARKNTSGVIFHEKGVFSADAENLAKTGGRALGSVISEIHNLIEFGIKLTKNLSIHVLFPY